MAEERQILMPEIGADPHPIRVVQWLVDRDSEVVAGDRILEVSATGVLYSVSAPWSGVLIRLTARMDATVKTGDVLGSLLVEPDEDLD